MKKLILFLFILFLPSIIACVVLYKYFPNDFKSLIEIGKEKLVTNYPFFKKYIQVAAIKQEKKEKLPPQIIEKPIISTLHHFTNAEIYAPICDKDITEKFGDFFSGCDFCPKYLINKVNENKFKYVSEVRGTILKKDDEEAIVFMSGCNQIEQNGTAILIKKGFGGWQRSFVYNDIQFDKEPLKFFDSNGMILFVARRTFVKDTDIKQELFSFQFKKNNVKQQNLFSIHMSRGLKCESALQGALEIPLKVSDKMFQSNLEIVGCSKTKLNGFYKVTFNLRNDDFKPNKETSMLMTKIEIYGE